MRITFNSEETEETEGLTIKELKEKRGLPATGVAIAVNGKIVTTSGHESFILHDGDDVIAIGAAYGG